MNFLERWSRAGDFSQRSQRSGTETTEKYRLFSVHPAIGRPIAAGHKRLRALCVKRLSNRSLQATS
jgi:hypothetical protein